MLLGTYDCQHIKFFVDGVAITGYTDRIFSLEYSTEQRLYIYLQHTSPSLKLFNEMPSIVDIYIPHGRDDEYLHVSCVPTSMVKYINQEAPSVGEVIIAMTVIPTFKLGKLVTI